MTGDAAAARHPSEEDLVLHYYEEAEAPAGLDAHLAGCAACRDAFDALRRSLDAVAPEPVPERGEDYGAAVWARLRPRLALGAKPRRPLLRRLAPVAIAASLLLAFILGRRTVEPPATVEVVRERVLLVALGDHLEQSQMVLVELANGPANGDVDISAERQRAEDLIAANRLYRRTAVQAGETAMASVLDDLERVLVEVARSPETLSSGELEALRQRIEAQGILFKVRVIESQVRARQKAAAPLRPAVS